MPSLLRKQTNKKEKKNYASEILRRKSTMHWSLSRPFYCLKKSKRIFEISETVICQHIFLMHFLVPVFLFEVQAMIYLYFFKL